MFGMSFGELVVLIVVAIVVIGPKELPKMLGKLGRFAGKMRRMASELRYQSGIDEVLRAEGIQENLTEIRKLARGELDQITEAARMPTAKPFDPDPAAAPAPVPAGIPGTETAAAAAVAPVAYGGDPYGSHGDFSGLVGARDREYPREGADDYGALPDTAFMYTQGFEPSALASDALYMTGDPNGIVVPPPAPPPSEHAEPSEQQQHVEPSDPTDSSEQQPPSP
ncbi:Sec-independent protein translocase protein TatB [Pendulispora rubella]|uniref:Sec-independent protein translocase protein TatB n=1 Tax=Pendulispora rubella TaxID=2741070 RepID=A0ABZ2LAJ8_9BACT